MSWNKCLYIIHGWLGLNFGLLLLIICLSGTIAVVSYEIDWLLTPTLRVTPRSTRASYGEMYEAVQQTYPDWPVQIAWAPVGSRFACEFWLRPPSGSTRRVYVDPYTARVLGQGSWFNTQRFFRDFHRRFFCHAWWGIWLVASCGFVLIATSATGLAFYRRWWAKMWVLRWGKGGRLFWSDLHHLCGIWTLLFSLLIGITGAWYFVEIPLRWAVAAPALPKLPESSRAADSVATDRTTVDAWVRAAQQAIPELEVGAIFFPQSARAPARIDGQAKAWLVRDRANKVLVDPSSGDVLFEQRAEQLGWLERWADSADPLHFGNFGGLTTKLIWVALGLALSALIPTGAYLWRRRAAQLTLASDKRYQRAAHVLTPQERRRLLQWVSRRHTSVGIVTTTSILLLAVYATYEALAKQWAEVDSQHPPVWHLGGPGPIVVYGGFLLLLLVVVLLWYRLVWYPALGPAAPASAVVLTDDDAQP